MAEKRSDDWFVCPHCGTVVRTNATSCPECGSDDNTGWAEDADRWTADIPTAHGEDDEFNYDEFIAREFGDRDKRGLRISVGIVVLVVLLLVVLLVLWMRSW